MQLPVRWETDGFYEGGNSLGNMQKQQATSNEQKAMYIESRQ
jgi:hypothetical protein